MKIRTKHSPLFLLLLPSLASALAPDAVDANRRSAALDTADDAIESAAHISVNSARRGVPTKDAPVDGKDGKPHLGPFIETDGARSVGDQEPPPLEGRPDDYTVIDGKEIPQTNDGVMFDKNRDHPQEGTTGTEGGVSEKERVRKAQEDMAGEKLQAQPESPKEQPPLPHSEEEKIKAAGKSRDIGLSEGDDTVGYAGLDVSFRRLFSLSFLTNSNSQKPDDLPDRTGQKPPPLPGSVQNDRLDENSKSGNTKTGAELPEDDEEGIIQPFHSFVLSLTMILVSEVGDKTFLVAALMAMKHDRMVVFTAAFGALLVMTVLSAILGHTVPTLIPRRLTSFLASGLFFVFGARLLREGMQMDPNEGVGAEMSEVEQELAEKEKELGRHGHAADPYTLEMGLNGRRSRSRGRFPSPPRSPSQSPPRSPAGSNTLGQTLQGVSNLFSLLLSPVWVQTFVMTFLGEWGDRSQIATIAMAAGQDYWWVTLGAMVGHAICTGAAVIGGRAIAGRVSLKVGKCLWQQHSVERASHANDSQLLSAALWHSSSLASSTSWRHSTRRALHRIFHAR